jgi:hypothetical protein
MQRRSDKHGPLQDEELEHEVDGMVHAGRPTHAEQWRDPEPAGDDQPRVGSHAGSTVQGDRSPGTPPGMDERDVELRSQLAVHLPPSVWPADRTRLLQQLAASHAPDRLVSLVRGAPGGVRYQSVQELSVALGLDVERERT